MFNEAKTTVNAVIYDEMIHFFGREEAVAKSGVTDFPTCSDFGFQYFSGSLIYLFFLGGGGAVAKSRVYKFLVRTQNAIKTLNLSSENQTLKIR